VFRAKLPCDRLLLLPALLLPDKKTFSLIIIDPLFILTLSAVHPRLFCALTRYIGSVIYNFSTLFLTTNSLSLGSLFCLLNAVDDDDGWLSVVNYCSLLMFGKFDNIIAFLLYSLKIRLVSYCNMDYLDCCYFYTFYLTLLLFLT